MNDLQLQIGLHCKHFTDIYDTYLVRRQEHRSLESTKEARIARKAEQAALLDEFEEEESLLYGFDIANFKFAIIRATCVFNGAFPSRQLQAVVPQLFINIFT
ncbi:uncharacterized protein LOC109503973 [Harpegnathos saltator]|uniref:uncharacterized protein LOC109503973 n=1 Tax=Harpegnathos saltator TaxID=610380 RepID=UPI000DBECEEA|nr:uncharacterized protein LOC109503973 [Harpegnathos saltator]